MALWRKTEQRSDDGGNPYIQQRGSGDWVIVQKGTGKVLSHHDSREKAEAAFRAMEMHKHGGE